MPLFASFRESAKKVDGNGEIYRVKAFTHGLTFASASAAPEIKTSYDSSVLSTMPAPITSDIPTVPGRDTWVNLNAGSEGRRHD